MSDTFIDFFKVPKGSTLIPYGGSKGRLFEELNPYLDLSSGVIHEPFAGSFSLSSVLLEKGLVKQAKGYDFNPYIIRFLSAVKDSPMELYSTICYLYSNVFKFCEFTICRSMLDSLETEQHTKELLDASFIYLAYRSNRGMHGDYINVSNCKLTDYLFQVLLKYSRLFESVEFHNSDYRNLKFTSNEFVFLDPPYESTNTQGFYGVTNFNHEELRDFVKGLTVPFLLTYNDSDFIRALYSGFNIQSYMYYSRYTKTPVFELAITR